MDEIAVAEPMDGGVRPSPTRPGAPAIRVLGPVMLAGEGVLVPVAAARSSR